MKNTISKLCLFNDTFVAGNKGILGNGFKETFVFTDYNTNLILTAPHSTRSFFHEKEKATDLYTGAIVKLVGTEHKISHIVKEKHLLKEEWISDFIIEKKIKDKYFLDFHGMNNINEFDLAIGTGYQDVEKYKKELTFIKKIADNLGIRIVINNEKYTGKKGLAGKLHNYNKNSRVLQLEWRENYRNFYANPDLVFNKTIKFMKELIEFINKTFVKIG